MIISEQEKKEILSQYQNYSVTKNIVLVEQNFELASERILKYLEDSKVGNFIRNLLPKNEQTIEKNLEKYITQCGSEGVGGSRKLLNLILNISNINRNFAKEFTKTWEKKIEEIYNLKSTNEEGLNSIERLFGKNIRNEFETLKKIKPNIKVTPKNNLKITLKDVLSNRVESTIKDKKVKDELETFLSSTFNTENYTFKWDPKTNKQIMYFVSETGYETPVTYLDWFIKGHVSGHETGLNDNLNKLPRKLSDGTEFRKKILNIIEKDIPEIHLEEIPPIDLRENWRVDTIPNELPDDLMNRQYVFLRQLTNMCDRYKGEPFDQTKIKIIGKQYITGRNVFEIKLPKGEKILCYESSGSNTETTGKKNGEWFVIPGFGKLYENGTLISDTWFIKTEQNVAITRDNQYFKDLDMFLRNIHGYQ